MKPVRLRYTGEQVKTFSTANVGIVEPQQEFDVPEDQAERFLVRADIELVSGGRKPRRTETGGDTGTSTETGGDAENAQGDPAQTDTGGEPAADTLV